MFSRVQFCLLPSSVPAPYLPPFLVEEFLLHIFFRVPLFSLPARLSLCLFYVWGFFSVMMILVFFFLRFRGPFSFEWVTYPSFVTRGCVDGSCPTKRSRDRRFWPQRGFAPFPRCSSNRSCLFPQEVPFFGSGSSDAGSPIPRFRCWCFFELGSESIAHPPPGPFCPFPTPVVETPPGPFPEGTSSFNFFFIVP